MWCIQVNKHRCQQSKSLSRKHWHQNKQRQDLPIMAKIEEGAEEKNQEKETFPQ